MQTKKRKSIRKNSKVLKVLNKTSKKKTTGRKSKRSYTKSKGTGFRQNVKEKSSKCRKFKYGVSLFSDSYGSVLPYENPIAIEWDGVRKFSQEEVRECWVNTVTKGMNDVSPECLSEIIGVMRKHGTVVNSSGNEFVNNISNSGIVDTSNVASSNHVLMGGWLSSQIIDDIPVEGFYNGTICEQAYNDFISLTKYMIDHGNEFSWGEPSDDPKTRVYGCFDMKKCKVNVINRGIKFHHLNALTEGKISAADAVKKHVGTIKHGFLDLPLKHEFYNLLKT